MVESGLIEYFIASESVLYDVSRIENYCAGSYIIDQDFLFCVVN